LVSHCKDDQLGKQNEDKLRRTLCQVFRQAFIFNQFKSIMKPEVSVAGIGECLSSAFPPGHSFQAKSALNSLIGTVQMKL